MGIEARNIVKRFPQSKRNVLDGISLDIADGEFVSLIGKSGSGKSTLLYILSSLDLPTEGSVRINEVDVASMGSRELHELRNRQIGFVFQFHYLLPELTVIENVLMPARKVRSTDIKRGRASGLLERFGLSEMAERYPRQLSGGEQQRVAVARALLMEPRYIFADEPTGNLDSVNGQRVIEMLMEMNREAGAALILVTHDPDFASYARRQIHLVDGRMV